NCYYPAILCKKRIYLSLYNKLAPIMKRTIFTLFFILSFINFGFAQNVKSLVKKANEIQLDIWDLTDFAKDNFNNKEQLARFFYYWIGSNIEYDQQTLQKLI